MREGILIMTMAILVAITYSQKQIMNKIDKLIELNTPEYINVVPEPVLIEKR